MTTNQMLKLFTKILKDAPVTELDPKTKAQIKAICKDIKELK